MRQETNFENQQEKNREETRRNFLKEIGAGAAAIYGLGFAKKSEGAEEKEAEKDYREKFSENIKTLFYNRPGEESAVDFGELGMALCRDVPKGAEKNAWEGPVGMDLLPNESVKAFNREVEKPVKYIKGMPERLIKAVVGLGREVSAGDAEKIKKAKGFLQEVAGEKKGTVRYYTVDGEESIKKLVEFAKSQADYLKQAQNFVDSFCSEKGTGFSVAEESTLDEVKRESQGVENKKVSNEIVQIAGGRFAYCRRTESKENKYYILKPNK